MSGHSKFANIKHKKEKNDAAKGKIFTKIGRELAVAVKEGGGPDPANNSRLRDVIAKAKSNNMPNDTIERNIKKAAGEGSGDNYEHITYEGYGPNGTAIIVKTLTDNKNRTASNVRNAFTKGSGNVGTPGCVSFMFDEKGQIFVAKEDCDMDADELMMLALDAGAEDFNEDEESYEILTDPDTFSDVRLKLEEEGIAMAQAEVTMIPQTYVELTSEEDIKNIQKTLDLLERMTTYRTYTITGMNRGIDMDTDRLLEKLRKLYILTLDYEFHKSSYAKYMDSLRSNYADLLQEAADVCDRTDDGAERIAACIPEYVCGELDQISSKRKRDLKALDHKMNMVSYFVPLMGEIPSLQAKGLTERMVELWNEKMPEYKIGHSTYESIKGGFKKGIFCYITTAVCRSMHKPDDCYELAALRAYRDGYLSETEEGRHIVEEYYNIAPTIVKRIDREDGADEIYQGIWDEYLSPCIRLIEEDKKEECKELYVTMVRSLEKKYLYS